MTENETGIYNQRKTPGVYITEIPAFGSSIVGVDTSVPVFIGYTEYAGDPATGKPLYVTPVPISSMADYASYFGGAAPGGDFNLVSQLTLFWENGGGSCYIVSAGSYWEGQTPVTAPDPVPADWTLATIGASDLVNGLSAAGNAKGPTMIVVPETCLLDQADYASVVQAMLAQAGQLHDRVAILDLPGCMTASDYPAMLACQSNLWDAIAPQVANLSYGAAYGPALSLPDGSVAPPSGAIAGVWTQSDTQNGVWNAPANIALAGVSGPLFAFNDSQQGEFNVPVNGQAIDIIRSQLNRGTVVWGARTLDGNSLDYRYIQVRRTLIYVEQSIKTALGQYVFAANDATTWSTVTASISSFLTGLWQQGGLMGTKASDAFTVSCGLGSTMTSQDILNGYMVVAVTLQMIHPAEFIELSFTQAMAT